MQMEGMGAAGGGLPGRILRGTLFAETGPDEDDICARITRGLNTRPEPMTDRKPANNADEPSDVSFVLAIADVICETFGIVIIGQSRILLQRGFPKICMVFFYAIELRVSAVLSFR